MTRRSTTIQKVLTEARHQKKYSKGSKSSQKDELGGKDVRKSTAEEEEAGESESVGDDTGGIQGVYQFMKMTTNE